MDTEITGNLSNEPELIRLAYAMVVEPFSHHVLAEAIDHVVANHYDNAESSPPEQLFERIEVHFNNALSLLERQGRKKNTASSSIKSIEKDPHPAALVRTDKSVYLSNSEGLAIHGWATGKAIKRSDFSEQGYDLFLNSLASFDVVDIDKAIGVVHIKSLDGFNTHPYLLSKSVNSEGEFLARLTSVNLSWRGDIAAEFQNSFNLTPIELRITRAIVTSQSLRDLAQERGRSLGTLRNQLKNLLAKLDLSSQTELACLYSGYVQLTKTDGSDKDNHNFRRTPWRRQSIFTARDSFVIDYSEVGPKAGRPVLFFHPALLGNSVCESMLTELMHRNIRLIMPWRPGFASTSLTKNRIDDHIDFANYCSELLDFLNIDKVQVIAENTGIIAAMTFVAAHSERVQGLFGISPIVPLVNKRYFKVMSGPQRSLYYIARHAPKLLPLVIRSIVAKCDSGHDYEWILNHFKDSPHDLELMTDPQIKVLARQTFGICYMNGIEGMVREYTATGQKWEVLFERIKSNITFVTGKHTGQFNSDILADFTQAMPNVTVNSIDGAAYFVLHQKTKQVFDLIDEQYSISGDQ